VNRFCPTILEKVNGFREEVARLVDECQKDQVGKPQPSTGARVGFSFINVEKLLKPGMSSCL